MFTPALVLGIMSGTSIDATDYALCDLCHRTTRLRARWRAAFPRALRERLHRCARGEASSHETAQLHHDLGRFYARHALRFPKGLKPALVGLHGQTVFHHPDLRAPATLQLGEPSYLAERLGVPVISNFRAGDIAVGGQGAPLAPLFHGHVFSRRGRHVCVQNLGGIGNVTSLDWTGAEPRVLAFDTGPANVLLDLAARQLSGGKRWMDRDGAWAARGHAVEPLLKKWLQHEFFWRKPPKSTGRELFGEPFLKQALAQLDQQAASPYEILATFTELTARSIALNYRLHLKSAPHRVIVTGGGAANATLFTAIQRHLRALFPEVEVVTSVALGWPIESIEPAAFALLAWMRWKGVGGNLPEATGARRPVLLGQLCEL